MQQTKVTKTIREILEDIRDTDHVVPKWAEARTWFDENNPDKFNIRIYMPVKKWDPENNKHAYQKIEECTVYIDPMRTSKTKDVIDKEENQWSASGYQRSNDIDSYLTLMDNVSIARRSLPNYFSERMKESKVEWQHILDMEVDVEKDVVEVVNGYITLRLQNVSDEYETVGHKEWIDAKAGRKAKAKSAGPTFTPMTKEEFNAFSWEQRIERVKDFVDTVNNFKRELDASPHNMSKFAENILDIAIMHADEIKKVYEVLDANKEGIDITKEKCALGRWVNNRYYNTKPETTKEYIRKTSLEQSGVHGYELGGETQAHILKMSGNTIHNLTYDDLIAKAIPKISSDKEQDIVALALAQLTTTYIKRSIEMLNDSKRNSGAFINTLTLTKAIEKSIKDLNKSGAGIENTRTYGRKNTFAYVQIKDINKWDYAIGDVNYLAKVVVEQYTNITTGKKIDIEGDAWEKIVMDNISEDYKKQKEAEVNQELLDFMKEIL